MTEASESDRMTDHDKAIVEAAERFYDADPNPGAYLSSLGSIAALNNAVRAKRAAQERKKLRIDEALEIYYPHLVPNDWPDDWRANMQAVLRECERRIAAVLDRAFLKKLEGVDTFTATAHVYGEARAIVAKLLKQEGGA